MSEKEDHGHYYTTSNDIWSRDLVTNYPNWLVLKKAWKEQCWTPQGEIKSEMMI